MLAEINIANNRLARHGVDLVTRGPDWEPLLLVGNEVRSASFTLDIQPGGEFMVGHAFKLLGRKPKAERTFTPE